MPYSYLIVSVLLVGTSDYGVWVGAHDIHSESQWIWSNGKPWFNEIQWARGNSFINKQDELNYASISIIVYE